MARVAILLLLAIGFTVANPPRKFCEPHRTGLSHGYCSLAASFHIIGPVPVGPVSAALGGY